MPKDKSSKREPKESYDEDNDPVNILYKSLFEATDKFRHSRMDMEGDDDDIITFQKILGCMDLVLESIKRHRAE